MTAKLLIEMPMNWAFAVELEPGRQYNAGRDPRSDIHLPNPYVQPTHARFFEKAGHWTVAHAEGLSGLVVNGEKVPEAMLADGDVINLGFCLVRFQSSAREDADEWKRTGELVARKQSELRNALDEAKNTSDSSAIRSLAKSAGASASSGVDGKGISAGASSASPSDAQEEQGLLQIGAKLADILGEVLAHPGSRDSVYKLMLTRLREAVGADNGFVMMPDPEAKRWVIRAWVGNAIEWSGKQSEFPVPLTVANRAFETGTVVSNALIGGENVETGLDPSASMVRLNVNSYVAVPICEEDRCRGVMYFDTRDLARRFDPRDVRMLGWAGAYIVEIEDKTA